MADGEPKPGDIYLFSPVTTPDADVPHEEIPAMIVGPGTEPGTWDIWHYLGLDLAVPYSASGERLPGHFRLRT